MLILLGLDVAAVLYFFWLLIKPRVHLGIFALLEPKGVIAAEEKSLIIRAVSLMLIVVIPVFFMLFFFAWKYRAGGGSKKYSPHMDNGFVALAIWAIPGTIIFILAGLIWQSTHRLDPYRPIDSEKEPVTVQVVALRWKWLFIYPKQGIASVNFLEFPENTPLNLELTADDAPMNSFWLPQLGGQMYAMTGMSTKLHLMANEEGVYQGSAAEISGQGFAGMRFAAKAVSEADFNSWTESVKASQKPLDASEYEKLIRPSENNQAEVYSSVEPDLYDSVIMKYMSPSQKSLEQSSTN